MSVHARRCEGCGGPLPEAPASATTITCRFCGVVHEVSQTRPISIQPTPRAPAGRTAPLQVKGSLWPVLIIFAVAFLMVGLVAAAFQIFQPGLRALDEVNRRAGRTPVPSGVSLALSDLPKYTERGYRQLIAPAPPSGWTGFDPVVGAAWATEIAHAWAPDARLTRIDLGLIAADGTADLTVDRQETVGYRFSSPSRIAQYERIADREVDASVPYELLIRVAGRETDVYVHSGRPPTEPIPPTLDSLPMRDVFSHAHQSGRFPDRPFYTGFLIYETRIGWVWTFSSLSGRDNIPIVRARDAAVYPWP